MTKILITGANQGSRSIEKGEEAVKVLKSNPNNHQSSSVKVVQIDVTNDESIKKAADLEDLKSLDVLVNNAGVYIPEQDKSEIIKIMKDTYECNVFGLAAVTEAFIPALKKSTQRASIVNVGSELGSITDRLNPDSPYKFANAIAYNSSKSAVNGITAYYANTLPEIRVVVVTPGYCATNLNGNSGPNTPQSGAEIIGKAALDKDGKSGIFIYGDGIFPW